MITKIDNIREEIHKLVQDFTEDNIFYDENLTTYISDSLDFINFIVRLEDIYSVNTDDIFLNVETDKSKITIGYIADKIFEKLSQKKEG